jgi:hypothetical protein
MTDLIDSATERPAPCRPRENISMVTNIMSARLNIASRSIRAAVAARGFLRSSALMFGTVRSETYVRSMPINAQTNQTDKPISRTSMITRRQTNQTNQTDKPR